MGARILLVDDEAAIRRQMSVGMAQHGFETSESEDGLSALFAIDRQARAGRPFDVVVTDMVLPDIDGLKLLSLVKSRYPDVRVIVISGYGDEETSERVSERHGDAFVPKPFALDDLARLVGGLRREAGRAVQPSAEPQRTAAAYALVEIERSADPWEVLRALAWVPGVLYCDPVRDGRYDLVLLLHGESRADLEAVARREIESRAGVARCELVPVERPALVDEIRSFIDHYDGDHGVEPGLRRAPSRATSYLVVDTTPAELPNLYVRLYFLDEVVEIDAAAAGDRLVLLLQGTDFGHIRRTINERIRLMDGVTRVHELKVVPSEQE